MNSINDLPRELLHKIIPLTVEDAVAIDDERSRRNILLNLALVSKEFTVPAQKLLWQHMDFDDVVKVQDLIGEGFGKDKVIKVFGIISSSKTRNKLKQQINLNMIKKFLYGILEVHFIYLRFLYKGHIDELKISNFFSIPSTKSLKSLSNFNDVKFTSEDSTPPPALTSFQCNFPEKNNDEVIAIFKSSVNSLRSLSIITSSSESIYNPAYIPSLRLAAPNLTSVSIPAFNKSVVEALLPFCTSLKSLTLNYSEYNFPQVKRHLSLLKSSVILTSLLLRWDEISISEFPSLIQILNSEPLKNLKSLHISSYLSDNDDLDRILQQEDHVFEAFKRKGVRLLVGTEEEVRIREEKAKQLAFNERQAILDAEVLSNNV